MKSFLEKLKKILSIFLIFNLTFVSTAQAAGVFVDSFDISNEDTTPQSLAFNNDGTKMFVVGRAGKDINSLVKNNSFLNEKDNLKECQTIHTSSLSEIFFETLDEIDCFQDPFSILK